MRGHGVKGWVVPLAVAALLAAGLGIAANRALGASTGKKAHVEDKVKVHVKHRTLFVEGTPGDDQIALRLRAGDPTRVEVVTQDGLAGHELRRDRFDEILVEAGDGNDRVAID